MQKIIIITGLSGAGMTTSLKVLEDMGYETIDGVPINLLPQLIGSQQPLAIGVDIRTRGFQADHLLQKIDDLQDQYQAPIDVIFLDCADDVIQRRYGETRHRHPLAEDRPVADGIRLERDLLTPLRQRADHVIDTTGMAIKDCKRILQAICGLETSPSLKVFVTSFSYKRGIPREADLVFDVRFLRNPHYDLALRPLTGEDPAVGAYIEQDDHFTAFFDNLTQLTQPLLPRYAAEGKSYLTIAFGCTGGQHRSVYCAEKFTLWLKNQGETGHLQHRELTNRTH